MSDLIAIIGSGAGMSAPAQKGVGGGRVAPLPAPRHRGQTPAPQNTPHHGCMGLRACIRPGRKRRRRRKAQPLAAPPVPTLGPHQEGAGVTSLSPQESGGRGGHVRHIQEGMFCLQQSFFSPGLSGSSDGAPRIPPYLPPCTLRGAGITPNVGAGPQRTSGKG